MGPVALAGAIIILALVVLLVLFVLKTVIHFLPAILVAVLAWFLTGSLFWTIAAFVGTVILFAALRH